MAAVWAILITLAGTGCGGATAPCPTPTTELDVLRNESERLEREIDRAAASKRAAVARREEAARRVAAIQAELDSLAVKRAR